VPAAVLDRDPASFTWPHCDASAWTATWLTARGRELLGPREMPLRPEWHGQLHWRERGETRRRGHRPDLATRLWDGALLPIEVELTEKSPARLKAVFALHVEWLMSGHSAGVIYICANQTLAEHVQTTGENAGLSVARGTLRVELLQTIKRQALEARGGAAAQDWGTIPTEAAA
jgi:hypothetical protein